MQLKKSISIDRLAFSLAEAAEQIGVSIGHLRNENKRGKLRFIKSGARTLVLAEDLRLYLQESELKAEQEA
ncbi:MAG: helix-turn-helix domain-containing protein [Acidobacteriota bacterium]|nr:helix-turn-helix domain-containing protein [Acidobacteriota bacterium]